MDNDEKSWYCTQCCLQFDSSAIYDLHLRLLHNSVRKFSTKNEPNSNDSIEVLQISSLISKESKSNNEMGKDGKKLFICEFCHYS